ELNTPVYLVGGAVRDLLMGFLVEKDFDLVMEAQLLKAVHLLAQKVGGSFFPLSLTPLNYRVVLRQNNQKLEIDFSELRGSNLYEDLLNRDFTINAIALKLNDLFGKNKEIPLYDPLGGKEDLKKRTLRVASPASFDQDPLRILRAIRIVRECQLQLEPQTRAKIIQQKELLLSVSEERVRSEFFKLLSFPEAQKSFQWLEELGLLSLLLPEKPPDIKPGLEIVKRCEWALDHLTDIFPEFSERVKNHLEEEIEESITRKSLFKLAAFLVAKKKVFSQEKALAWVEKLSQRFKLGKKARMILKKMIKFSPQLLFKNEINCFYPRVLFQLLRKVESEMIEIMLLSWADYLQQINEPLGSREDFRTRKWLNYLLDYYFNEYPLSRPLISGQDIMVKFGLNEGKIVGKLLNQVALMEAEGKLHTSEEAIQYVENYLREKDYFKS
ncbi:MAG: hypothetical protein N3A64_04970, partial [Desulfobacterota bacterium]|nr:hypothetical protein [Thermodesulfobacteriota bacterium]